LFLWNNVHRYFLYASFIVIAFLWYDAVLAFLPGGTFGIKVGSLIWLVNVILLTTYTTSCHSLRHLIGGKMDCYSCVRGGNARRKAYNWVSVLNGRHAMWAWVSLTFLLITDVYMRLIAAGVIPDLTILG
ncbi:MAG: succinate dehydrogenase, partial [Rubrobacteraceae bacterium]